jgi:hypothetical protein
LKYAGVPKEAIMIERLNSQNIKKELIGAQITSANSPMNGTVNDNAPIASMSSAAI